jgi:heat shock protein HslJ
MPTPSRLVVPAAVAAGLLLAACVDGTGRDATYGLVVVPDLTDLSGDTFVADGIVDPDRELVSGTRIAMSFATDSVNVNAGCNTLSGTATIDDYELVLGHLRSTRKACDQALEEQDQWLTSFLTARPHFDRVDDDLYLSRDDTVIHLVRDDDWSVHFRVR